VNCTTESHDQPTIITHNAPNQRFRAGRIRAGIHRIPALLRLFQSFAPNVRWQAEPPTRCPIAGRPFDRFQLLAVSPSWRVLLLTLPVDLASSAETDFAHTRFCTNLGCPQTSRLDRPRNLTIARPIHSEPASQISSVRPVQSDQFPQNSSSRIHSTRIRSSGSLIWFTHLDQGSSASHSQ
jgi:hypothetical protein